MNVSDRIIQAVASAIIGLLLLAYFAMLLRIAWTVARGVLGELRGRNQPRGFEVGAVRTDR